MQKDRRLTRESDFARVFAEGRKWVHPLLVLRVVPSESEVSRYGFSVSKRLGNAVVRNRVKRVLREVARLTPVKPGWDIVVVARAPAGRAGFHEIRAALEQLLRRARLLENESRP